MTTPPALPPESPKWGSTTKLVVSLAFIAIFAALVVAFRNLIGPLLLAFILAFILHPVAAWASRVTHLSWRMTVNLIYLLLAIVLIALLTLAGLAIVQQAQSLLVSIQEFIRTLPDIVSDLSSRSYSFGPFVFDPSQYDLQPLLNQVLNLVQPLLGQAGSLLGRVAASAATTTGWIFFVLLISYFLLAEGGQLRENLVHIEIPGYNADVDRLVRNLSATWDAFLRGMLLISLLVIVAYYLLLTILGTRLALVIALLAGLARFVPWVGPLITWTVVVIVALLQPSNYFGLQPIYYALLVLGLCLLLDQVFDNLVQPRLMGRRLGLHPAGVLVAALIATRLLGLVGLVLAAPVLATLTLVSRYMLRKLFDLPPWPPEEQPGPPPVSPWIRLNQRLQAFWALLKSRREPKR